MKRLVSVIMLTLLLTSMLTLAFNIQPVKAEGGTIYIRADGSVDPPTAPISTVDNAIYTFTANISSDWDGIVAERSNIVIDGAGYTLQGSGSGNGFVWSGINNVRIKRTNIKRFYYGILLLSSSNNIISGNNITNNGYGIWPESSSNNTISGNNITNNGDGILLLSSSNNRVFHNNLINNARQVYSINSVNVWDDGYPSGGNYWSDYNGTDSYRGSHQNETGSDGIGDTPYIINENNTDKYPLIHLWTLPDIAVVNLTASKTVVGEGFLSSVNATVENQGNKIEAFNISVYANAALINSQVLFLTGADSAVLTFDWNTSGFPKGNYTLSAYAWPVPGETDTADNTYTDGWVKVTVAGDINGDGIVNAGDLGLLGAAWFSNPNSPIWNPNADITGDEVVNAGDLGIIGVNWFKT